MTLAPWDVAFYAGALAALFLTPGPVWVALVAGALSGGPRAAWPLAAGVAAGDGLWSLLAIFGATWILSVHGGILGALDWVAAGIFLLMGALAIRGAGKAAGAAGRLARPGAWAGFLAGLAAILGNPKAVLFYMGVLPGFFDLARLTGPDAAVIVLASMAVPLAGNLAAALLVGRARRRAASPRALRRTGLVAGGLLICVGLAIPLA